MQARRRSARGFSLVETMLAVGIGATLVAISVPAATTAIDSMRLSGAMREVERDLQTARLRAVSKNRMMEVRLNCPTARQYRVVEITGVTATDTAPNRCSESAFPYPGPRDNDPATPAQDGPLRQVHMSISLSGPDLIFAPNGTTMTMVAGIPQRLAAPATVTITWKSQGKTINVNTLGKIQIQ